MNLGIKYELDYCVQNRLFCVVKHSLDFSMPPHMTLWDLGKFVELLHTPFLRAAIPTSSQCVPRSRQRSEIDGLGPDEMVIGNSDCY